MDQNNCWLKDRCSKVDCNTSCMRFFKTSKLYELALLSPDQYTRKTLYYDADGTDRSEFAYLSSIEENITSFVKEGSNLFIHSQQAGNGKTSWALRLLQVYIEKNWIRLSLDCRVLFISVPRFLLAIKDNINERSEYVSYIKENILKADLVVWDDVGNKKSTEFEDSHLLSMIDARLSEGKSNVFTSNLYGQDLHEALGDRLYSRIVNRSVNLELKGADKRGLGVRVDFSKSKE